MKEIYLKNLNASIYIDSADVVNEKDFDGKIRVYDSNKNYFDYFEEDTFWTWAEEMQTSFKFEYELEVITLSRVESLEELLEHFCINSYTIATEDCLDPILEAFWCHLELFEKLKKLTLEEQRAWLLSETNTIKVGKYYVLLWD